MQHGLPVVWTRFWGHLQDKTRVFAITLTICAGTPKHHRPDSSVPDISVV